MEHIGLAHLDVKLGNILWDSTNLRLKLIDFETALDFHSNPEQMKTPYETKRIFGHTECFCPPEYESSNTIIPQKYDPYSFGVTFYIMLMKAKDSKFIPGEKSKILVI